MYRRIKWFIIGLAFKLVDIPEYKTPKSNLIEDWMAESWQHPGFREYMRIRDRDFVKALSGGIGAQEVKRDDYIRYIGQRIELQRFGKKCQNAFEIKRNKKS